MNGHEKLRVYTGEASQWKDWRFEVTTWRNPDESVLRDAHDKARPKRARAPGAGGGPQDDGRTKRAHHRRIMVQRADLPAAGPEVRRPCARDCPQPEHARQITRLGRVVPDTPRRRRAGGDEEERYHSKGVLLWP